MPVIKILTILEWVWKKIEYALETNPCKELALLFAGALASVLGGLLIQTLVFNRLILILGVGVFFLILYGSGTASATWHSYNIRRRKSALNVGILHDMGWDLKNKEIYSWTDIGSEEWKKEIEELARNKGIEIKVNLINVGSNFDRHIAIINPYGGVYPEYDLRKLQTMNKILGYINEGGLFVNVADIPGYFACNPLITPYRKIDTGLKDAPYAYGYFDPDTQLLIPVQRYRHLQLTPFTRELGLDVWNTGHYSSNPIYNWGVLEFENGFKNISSGNIKIIVNRAAVCKEYLNPIIKPKSNPMLLMKFTPLFFVTYGKGKLLSSLIWENEQEEKTRKELKKMLAKVVIDYIQTKMKK